MKYAFIFIFSFLTWVVFSGFFDWFHLSLGLISSLLVTLVSGRLLFDSSHKNSSDRLREVLHIPAYAIWLLVEITKANLTLLKIVYSPNVIAKLNPRVYTFKTSKLDDDFSKYVMGVSITLVPGTVTIGIDENEFLVHAITDDAAEGLPEPMESKIAKIFSRSSGEQ